MFVMDQITDFKQNFNIYCFPPQLSVSTCSQSHKEAVSNC